MAQLVGGKELSLGVDVAYEGVVSRSWNVAGHGIDRLVLAGKAIGSPSVDEQGLPARERSTCDRLRQLIRRHEIDIGGLRDELPGRTGRGVCRYRQPGSLPRRKSSIEHGHFAVAYPAQQPPQPRSVGAVSLVVGNDLGLSALRGPIDSPTAERRGELLPRRQGMPSGARLHRTRQVAIQVAVRGSGNVALGVGAGTPFGPRQLEAAVDDRPVRACEERGELVRLDQRGWHPISSCNDFIRRIFGAAGLSLQSCQRSSVGRTARENDGDRRVLGKW